MVLYYFIGWKITFVKLILNLFLQGGYSPSGPGGAPSDYYGSIGYGTYGAVSFGQMSWRGSQAQLWGGPGSPPSVAPPPNASSSNGFSPGSSPSTPSPVRAPLTSNGRTALTTPRQVKALSNARHRKKSTIPPQDHLTQRSMPRPPPPPPSSAPQRPSMPVYMSTWAWSPRQNLSTTSLPPMSTKSRTTPRRSTPMSDPAYAGINPRQFRRYRLITNNL